LTGTTTSEASMAANSDLHTDRTTGGDTTGRADR
jgi:hypothetical protein